MSFPARNPDAPLSERLTKAIQSEMRREIHRIYEEEAKKTAEIDDLRKKIREVTELNETLMRTLKLKKNKDASVDEEIKRISDTLETHIKRVLESEPSKGWHVGKLWGRATNRLPDSFDIRNYVMTHTISEVSGIIYRLLVHIDKYEREVEKYDENLNRWAKQTLAGPPAVAFAGYQEHFACPKGGNCTLPFVDKLLEKSEFNIRAATIPEEKYPKVKV